MLNLVPNIRDSFLDVTRCRIYVRVRGSYPLSQKYMQIFSLNCSDIFMENPNPASIQLQSIYEVQSTDTKTMHKISLSIMPRLSQSIGLMGYPLSNKGFNILAAQYILPWSDLLMTNPTSPFISDVQSRTLLPKAVEEISVFDDIDGNNENKPLVFEEYSLLDILPSTKNTKFSPLSNPVSRPIQPINKPLGELVEENLFGEESYCSKMDTRPEVFSKRRNDSRLTSSPYSERSVPVSQDYTYILNEDNSRRYSTPLLNNSRAIGELRFKISTALGPKLKGKFTDYVCTFQGSRDVQNSLEKNPELGDLYIMEMLQDQHSLENVLISKYGNYAFQRSLTIFILFRLLSVLLCFTSHYILILILPTLILFFMVLPH
jgi:hypothetical protein